jgi:hypothetical protein
MQKAVRNQRWIFCLLFVCGILGPLYSQEGARFLIITADEFAQAIDPLADWKYEKGIETAVVRLSDIDPSGFPSKEQIKDCIQNAYASWDPQPRFVLLVGDTAVIPKWRVDYCYCLCTDNPYGDMEGNLRAEISVGRFAVGDIEGCETMVAKTLSYERTPGIQGLDWLGKATLVLREDPDSNGPYWNTMEYIEGVLNVYEYDTVNCFVDTLGGGGDDKWDVIEAINAGRAFLVYRGSSSYVTWYGPFDITPSELEDSVHNGWMLPIMVSGTCNTGHFDYPNAMCNTWTQAGDAENPKGCVAFLGTSTVSGSVACSWSRSYVTEGLFEAIFENNIDTLGSAFLEAKLTMYTHVTDSIMREKEYYGWNLIGDPTLQVYTGIPAEMTVQHIGTIEADIPTNLEVIVQNSELRDPIEGALVTLYKPGTTTPEIFEVANTDINGTVIFENLTVPTSGTVSVTVTYHDWLTNYVPYQGKIQVYQIMTDDPLALAYNGNRHLVRKPNTEELHLTYVREGEIVYRYSSNGGSDWSVPVSIGEGEYPTITLSSDYLPSVTWTDDNGGLWYRRKILAEEWSDTYHLWNPIGVDAFRLNSPPSIAIHASRPNTVHILVTRTGGPPIRDVTHAVEDYTFPITQPIPGTFVLIEQALGPQDPPLRSFPSIASCEVDNSLHATWQRVDTICYAWKPKNNTWINWGDAFYPQGHQSAHPFVETYGDMIYVVWQHLVSQKEDVYRAEKHISWPSFQWRNLSLTPNTVSLYPVNASGFFTVFVDEPYPPVNSNYEIYYRVDPEDPLINLSQTELKSIYPQAAARFSLWHRYLYTSWLENNEEPYEIRFKKIEYIDPTKGDPAYLTSAQGNSLPSAYLVARDSFISDWQVPVDIGNTATTYQFPLIPGYAYKARAVFYHENSGPWSGRIRIDNNLQFVVTYNANVPETLECWIPPALYEDSVLTVSFSRIAGNFAAIGPIYIYRYEYDVGGGPMSQQSSVMNDGSIAIFPNPFKDQLHILNQTPNQDKINLQLYDITGRLVKRFDLPSTVSFDHITWNGIDDNGRAVPQGVYFLRIDNLDTGGIICRKVLMVK